MLLNVVIKICMFQVVLALDRNEITNEYKPFLDRLENYTLTKYDDCSTHTTILTSEMRRHQKRSENATQTQIVNIKEVIRKAKNSSILTPFIEKCLKIQESKINTLTIADLKNCYPSRNVTLLNNSQARLKTLAYVAGNTIPYCQKLNPLDIQLEQFESCITGKTVDLWKQSNLVIRQYEILSNDTLKANVNCLAEGVGEILGQISVITYQINICFF